MFTEVSARTTILWKRTADIINTINTSVTDNKLSRSFFHRSSQCNSRRRLYKRLKRLDNALCWFWKTSGTFLHNPFQDCHSLFTLSLPTPFPPPTDVNGMTPRLQENTPALRSNLVAWFRAICSPREPFSGKLNWGFKLLRSEGEVNSIAEPSRNQQVISLNLQITQFAMCSAGKLLSGLVFSRDLTWEKCFAPPAV